MESQNHISMATAALTVVQHLEQIYFYWKWCQM